jgi:glyoxylase-like metal-dependent hydrolase (beta-lactamase superfamily II)
MVSSYAIDDGARLLLFDPLAIPAKLERLAGEREPAIVLTVPWHERGTRSLVEKFGWPVYAPHPDTPQDFVEKFGVTAEQAAGGSPDLRWLVDGEAGEGHFYSAGDRLPVGVEAFPGMEHNDLLLWVESHRALVAGDTLQDRGRRPAVPR